MAENLQFPCKKSPADATNGYPTLPAHTRSGWWEVIGYLLMTSRRDQMTKQTTGIAIATAAAAIFAMGAITATPTYAAEGSVHCVGANSCKGSSECKSAKNDCKGMNACKGQGWVSKASEKECKDAGGTVAGKGM
jgi:hypothetical protein